MLAEVTGLGVGEFVHTLGDAHLYLNHLEQARTQLSREPRALPTLRLNPAVKSIFDFRFERKTALIVGNERSGLDEESLKLVHRVVEIPMFGLPYALNVATATAMARRRITAPP